MNRLLTTAALAFAIGAPGIAQAYDFNSPEKFKTAYNDFAKTILASGQKPQIAWGDEGSEAILVLKTTDSHIILSQTSINAGSVILTTIICVNPDAASDTATCTSDKGATWTIRHDNGAWVRTASIRKSWDDTPVAAAPLASPPPVPVQATDNPVQQCLMAETNFLTAFGREFKKVEDQWPTNMWTTKRYDRVQYSLRQLPVKKNMEITAGGVHIDCDKEAAELLDYVLHGANE
jgi:hypothetical protein